MIQSLSIKNLALIKNENIDFKKGLNIILGETGAGKSLIFEALFFVLGFKSDKTLIRSGEETMKVELLFQNLSQSVLQELENMEIEADGEILVSRSLSNDGRSTAKINNQLVTLSSLKNLSKMLVDSLVQHEGLELLKTKNHILLLDSFIGDKSAALKQEIGDLLKQMSDLSKQIDSLGGDEIERERRKEILMYQIEEIEKAEIQLGEEEQLSEKLTMLASAEKIQETLSTLLKLLSSSDGGAVSNISSACRGLGALSNIEKLSVLQKRLEDSKYEVEDIYEELSDIYCESNFDEVEFERLDARKDLYKSLKKKYGATVQDVLDYYEKIKKQYDDISGSEITIEKLSKERVKLEEKCQSLATELSRVRKEQALAVKDKMVEELKDLGMKGTKFEIEFSNKNLSADGIDDVVFTFSANAGQEVKNISKTASGGETSRIMLALKNIFVGTENKTLLFDEVDSGISGETGNMVAQKLKNIAEKDQIICITHLPQVASAGDNFVKVSKEVVDGETYSNASVLQEENVPKEIASLISGQKLSNIALQNAKELRSKYKNN